MDVTLVTAGGEPELHEHLLDIAGRDDVPGCNSSRFRARSARSAARRFSRAISTTGCKPSDRFDLGLHHSSEGRPDPDAGRHSLRLRGARDFRADAAEQRCANASCTSWKDRCSTPPPCTWPPARRWPSRLTLGSRLSNDFSIVPNAGLPPLDEAISDRRRPVCLLRIHRRLEGPRRRHSGRARRAGSAENHRRHRGGMARSSASRSTQTESSGSPRVRLHELPEALAGARAGLIPTNPDMPSGEFSCPMKLFDYARCGLPVLSTRCLRCRASMSARGARRSPSPSRARVDRCAAHISATSADRPKPPAPGPASTRGPSAPSS